MNAIKSLGKLIFGDSKNPDLLQINSGQLDLVRPDSPKGSRECIYKDAQATIRRTNVDFNYQLEISRVYEEGEEELEDGEGLEEDAKSFVIDEALKFNRGTSEDSKSTTFSWADYSGDTSERFEFICDGATDSYIASAFETTIYNCMYERHYRKPYQQATDEELRAFQYNPAQPNRAPSMPSALTTPIKHTRSPPTSKRSETSAKSTPTSPSDSTVAAPEAQQIPESDGEILGSAKAELHLFDPLSAVFKLQAADVKAEMAKIGVFSYWLSVSGPNRAYIGQPVEPKMNPVFNAEHKSFIWNYYDESGVYSWLLRFPDQANESVFRDMFGKCMYETLNELNFAKAKQDEQKYIMSAFQDDVEMSDADAAKDDEDETDSETEEDAEGDDDDDNEEEGAGGPRDDAQNSQLAVGYKHDRSFVVRGSKIGVFKHTDDERLEFATTISDVQNLKGKSFSPSKVMLHQEDSSMLLMDPHNEHSIYKMDLEYGKVVEEWAVHDVIPTANIIPDTKYAQMSGQQTLIGMSHNSLYRIDPRLAGSKLVDGELKQYATKNDFSCAATTAKGQVAVASNKGDIRLFDKLGKNAKTALPALGDPIIGIDVTADGRYLIATCATYLLLIDAEIKSDSEKRLGFDKSFPKEQKPVPKRLQLRPEHVAYMGKQVSFTTARFNTGVGEEKTIVTSTGPFVITWNFRRVKQGRLYDYQIKCYSDNVVADNFKYGQDRAIVVALPHDVTMATKKQLQAPSKDILTTPTKKLQSRSKIVNSPY